MMTSSPSRPMSHRLTDAPRLEGGRTDDPPMNAQSPAARARRALWIKFVVAIVGGVAWALIAAEFAAWFAQHTFLTSIIIAVAIAAWLVFTVGWRSSVPCPNCGWNINLS